MKRLLQLLLVLLPLASIAQNAKILVSNKQSVTDNANGKTKKFSQNRNIIVDGDRFQVELPDKSIERGTLIFEKEGHEGDKQYVVYKTDKGGSFVVEESSINLNLSNPKNISIAFELEAPLGDIEDLVTEKSGGSNSALSHEYKLTLSDFTLEQNALYHQRIFEPTDTLNMKNKLLDQLRLITGVSNISDQGDYITAEISGMTVDWKKHGANTGLIPIIAQGPMAGRIRIDLKPGRYRTTVNSIVFTSSVNLNWKGVKTDDVKANLEEFTLIRDRSRFRSTGNTKRTLLYLDKHFTDMFTIKEVTSAKEDW